MREGGAAHMYGDNMLAHTTCLVLNGHFGGGAERARRSRPKNTLKWHHSRSLKRSGRG